MKKNILLLMIFIKCSGIPHGYERISDESKIIKYYDKVEKITFFHHLELNNLNRNRNLLIYIREQEGRKSLHLKISYRGNNWIFFDEILLTNGDQNIIFNIPLYNKYTDVS
ncbi:hypothetical protein, partial [Leptospira levettii]|uniref:hypothetical protein n=1 Tax=Leptospira levettii TaxID=2023178 RepID=UPI001AEF5182